VVATTAAAYGQDRSPAHPEKMRNNQQEDGCDGDHYGGGQPWNDSMSAEMPDERTCRRAQDKPDWIQVFNFH